MRKRLQFIEIDVPVCSLSYGIAPCIAAIGVTGDAQCFNTKRTCQSKANYAETLVTLRFAVDVGEYLPKSIPCIPNIMDHSDISFTAGEISLGKNLGTRSSLKVVFRDHPHSDAGAGYDPYWRERGIDPFKLGSHWGKFRARQPFLQGRNLRWIQGFAGQELAEMETRHFFIENFDGPGLDGIYSITAKDILKFLDDDRALAPRPNNGELDTLELGASDVAAQLFPVGIGDAEYAAGGWLAIGGAEVVEFTRTGDTLTIVRARLGTEAVEHERGDRVQAVLRFEQQRVSDILNALLTQYCGIDPSLIPLDAWHDEDDAYIGRLYTGSIAEPTSVRKLVNELIEEVGLAIWWDDIRRLVQLQAIRRVQPSADKLTPNNVDEGSLSIAEQPTKRISEMLVAYGLRSPLHPLNDFTSYREARFLRSGEAEEDHGAPSYREVHSRWITRLQTNTAARVGAVQIGRFRDPPRKFSFSVFRQEGGIQIEAGGRYQLSGWPMQDAVGNKVDVPIQVTRLTPRPERFMAEAEEMTFSDLDLGDIGDPDPPPPPDSPPERIITLDSGSNINLRAIYNSLYPDFGGATEEDKLPVTFLLPSGRRIHSESAGTPAVVTGNWPTNLVTLKLINRGRIQGRGGNGGRGSIQNPTSNPGAGQQGGAAIQATVDLDLDVQGGEVWGGGGGGGGAAVRGGGFFLTPTLSRGGGGGGGAGTQPGNGGEGPGNAQNGQRGTDTTGGIGGASWTKESFYEFEYLFPGIRGGQGGGPGQPGQTGAAQSGSPVMAPGVGGAAGPSIRGIGFVSITGSGSILGPQIS
jgi:hypothetical protein